MGCQGNENPSSWMFDEYNLMEDISVTSLLDPTGVFASTSWPSPPPHLSFSNPTSLSMEQIDDSFPNSDGPKEISSRKSTVYLVFHYWLVAVFRAEKNELRDEKQRLKVEKENLEKNVKALSTQPGYLPHPPAIPAPFSAPGQVVGSKLVPFMGYPGVSMWQFMPPASVDTSQDHVLRPPVA
ncbi:transcription factor ilr3 [Quercus suber]|uniref:Transcription factor ilr3 n=1 Tax=Quercus suber TaxID=58331 RepID=A0AAW0JZ33_QUESU